MAYVSQEMKKRLAPAIKAVLKRHRVKASISVNNHSTLCVNISTGAIDFVGEQNKKNQEISSQRGTPFIESDGYIQVNEYYPETYGDGAEFLTELVAAMKGPDYYCNDDIMSDYFHRSHYTSINVGKWNKPYVYNAFVGL